MIDTHCHLTFPELSGRLEEVLADARAAGVDRMLTIGTTPADARRAAEIAAVHPGVRFASGLHPHYIAQVPAAGRPDMLDIAEDSRCLAFGEMGLDYHYDDPPRPMQREIFEELLGRVKSFHRPLPVILHCRKAVDDALSILRQSGLPGDRFVFHCFTESLEDARKVLDFGAKVSFTGIATYKNAPEVRESARLVPADRLMIETDAPYLSPEPHRKIRPNEPKFLPATARHLAEWLGRPLQEFIETCDRNAEQFFGWE